MNSDWFAMGDISQDESAKRGCVPEFIAIVVRDDK